MNTIYGYYKLDLTCEQFDAWMDRMISQLLQNNSNMNGLPTQSFDDYQSGGPVGVSPLTGIIDGEHRIIGVGYYDNDVSRCWIVAANNGHGIFFDAAPTIVTELGLAYNELTKEVYDPVTNTVFVNLMNFIN